MKQNYDVVVVGGGPGGYTAALYCARSGYSVAVVEKLAAGGQMATTGVVENYPGFDEGIDGFELGEKMQKGAERFGAETVFADVTAVDLRSDPKTVATTSGAITARAVVLATGAVARELGVPGEAELRGHGVAYCATCDGMLYKGKTVVVVGGGNTAATDALYLTRVCRTVYLVHRRDTLRASRVYLERLEKAGVQFLWNSRVTELLHDKRVTGVRVENVQTGESREIACDGVFAAVGRTPDTALFQGQVEMDPQGYLVADESTRTSVPGVFAVGDARAKAVRQIVTAAADGASAAHYIEEFLL